MKSKLKTYIKILFIFGILLVFFMFLYSSYFKNLFYWHKESERFSIEQVKNITLHYYKYKEYTFLLNNEEKYKVLDYIRNSSFVGTNNKDGLSLTGGAITIEWSDGEVEQIPWEKTFKISSRYQVDNMSFYLKSEELNEFISQKTIHIN